MKPIHRALLAVILSAVAGHPAFAVLPPETYQEARRSADHHVQMDISTMRAPRTTPGVCKIEGQVVQVFRSREATLKPGMALSFSVDCLRAGDRPGVGGVLWGSVADLSTARYVEVYLNGKAQGPFSVARWQYRIIPKPTDEPLCPVKRPHLTCW